MRNGFPALLVLLVISSLTRALDAGGSDARPFSISSLNTAFVMQGDFGGEYRVYPNRIELKITKANIRISEHCQYKGRGLLSAVKFGLATGTDDGRWKIAHGGQEFFLEQVISSGDIHSLGELYFSIPKDDSVDLSKHWLVVQMEVTVLDVPEEKRLKGYAYAHSCRDIFTAK
jgi:hypothetical protein